MNAKLKAFLIISAKQAVGAVIGNSTLYALMPKTFNFHDKAGWMALGSSTLSFIISAEGKVWIPRILAWVNSPTEPPFVPKP